MSTRPSQFRPVVRRSLPPMVAFRFVINVGVRMTYTFLPAFARGTGMSVETMSRVLSARELTSLTATLAGRAADRRGTARLMVWAAILCMAGLSVSLFGAPGFIAGMLVFGIGRTAYQVAMQAWVGDEVAYERRGRATGLIELSWGGASLIGLPLVGLMIDGASWRLPLIVLSIAALPLTLRLNRLYASGEDHAPVAARAVTFSGAVVAALVVNGSLTAAAQFLFLAHGLWLEDTYGLEPAEIGFAVIAVGAVEVIATLGSARLTDTIGKRRSMQGGAVLMTLAMGVLAWFPSPPLAIGLALLVMAFLGFEYGIVSAIPLMAELDPLARARMIAIALTVSTVTRAVITLVATSVYLRYGFSTTMTVAAVFGVISAVLAATAMSEPTTADAG